MALDALLSRRVGLSAAALGGLAALLLVGVGAIAVGLSWGLEETLRTVVGENVSSLRAVQQVESALFDQKGLVANFLHEPQDERWMEELEHQRGRFEEGLAATSAAAFTAGERALVEELRARYLRYDELRQSVIDLARSGRRAEALALHLREGPLAVRDVSEACDGLLALNHAQIASSEAHNQVLFWWLRAGVWGGTAGVLILGGAAGWLLARGATRRMVASARLAAMGQLGGSMAHEVRNPMAAILLRLDALAADPGLPGACLEDVAAVQAEVERVERIVSNFLHLVQRPEPRPRAVAPAELIARVRELAGPLLRRDGVRLETHVEPELPPSWGDPDQLLQALLNLLLNASQATPTGGTVTLTAGADVDGWTSIEVRDTGRGIPPKLHKRVFEPFFSTRPGGVGLGLWIVRSLVEQQGGSIELEAAAAQGACFRIRLPARSRAGAAAPRQAVWA